MFVRAETVARRRAVAQPFIVQHVRVVSNKLNWIARGLASTSTPVSGTGICKLRAEWASGSRAGLRAKLVEQVFVLHRKRGEGGPDQVEVFFHEVEPIVDAECESATPACGPRVPQ